MRCGSAKTGWSRSPATPADGRGRAPSRHGRRARWREPVTRPRTPARPGGTTGGVGARSRNHGYFEPLHSRRRDGRRGHRGRGAAAVERPRRPRRAPGARRPGGPAGDRLPLLQRPRPAGALPRAQHHQAPAQHLPRRRLGAVVGAGAQDDDHRGGHLRRTRHHLRLLLVRARRRALRPAQPSGVPAELRAGARATRPRRDGGGAQHQLLHAGAGQTRTGASTSSMDGRSPATTSCSARRWTCSWSSRTARRR